MNIERVLCFRSRGFWVSIFLDHYLVTFCKESRSILKFVRECYQVHQESSKDLDLEPLIDLPSAPVKYLTVWEDSANKALAVPIDEETTLLVKKVD